MATVMTSCVQDTLDVTSLKNKEIRISSKTRNKIAALGMKRDAPIMIRIFKEEGVLEVWKSKPNGRYEMVTDYKICAWSGMLGPKKKEGDRQAPEGFYDITPGLMNPYSNYYLSINMGYPNAFDRSLSRTGSELMIHGACSSRGCYSMTDLQMQEIYALAKEAFDGGQRSFQIQALPFRMTPENMARHAKSEHYEFWKMLKIGYDYFELTHRPPEVAVCENKYVFNQMGANGLNPRGACPAQLQTPPALASAYTAYQQEYEKKFAAAERKYDGYIWDEPTEAERKALVAKWRAQHKDNLAFAPTGSALEAGKLVRIKELQEQQQAEAEAKANRELAQKAAEETAKTTAQVAEVPVPEANPTALQEEQKQEPRNKLWDLFSFGKK
nr:murein L,D-transpeptidase family protein [Rhizobium sp. L1K21]